MGNIRRDIEINPLFPVPPGVIDVRQEYDESTTSSFDESDVVTVDTGGTVPDEVVLNPLIPTVTSMTILKQEVRFTTDGRGVVDVIATFPVSNEVIELQVQLTKT